MLIQNIKVAVDAVVFAGRGHDRQLLLIKRKNDPYKGMWALPGGFVEDDEELDTAAMRELEEETGLKVNAMTQLYTFGRVGRDSRGRTVTVTYYTSIDSPMPVAGADDATEATWVPVKDISALAFDHMEMLQMALERL
ncbi:MAG: NUDIX hydrolase [Chitinophagaceae bacterium]|nr:NUDIX hydrolase [Chitinophagaceae bacterium]